MTSEAKMIADEIDIVSDKELATYEKALGAKCKLRLALLRFTAKKPLVLAALLLVPLRLA